MKTNNVIAFPNLTSTVHSNSFTKADDPFRIILNDDDQIMCMKAASAVVYEDGACQFKAMVALPSDDSWFRIMAEYPSVDQAEIIMKDLIANVRVSATIADDTLDSTLLEMELSINDHYGFSFLFPTNFQFQRNVQS
jgi:hypothetical protein